MAASSGSVQLQRLRGDVANLRGAVDEALYVAQEALRGVQHLASEVEERHSGPSPSQALSEAVLEEHLQAFEAYIIGRVREETAGAAASGSASVVGSDRSLVESHPASAASVAGRRVELQLEAQRTRSTAMEQRLGQLEAKLNALMTDVVAQSQREVAHHKQMELMVHEHVDREMRVAVASASVAPPPPPAGVADVSLLHHMTAALAAMHDRVEEQHAELVRFQQQHFALMGAVVKQLDGLKVENASLRQQVHQLQSHARQPACTAAPRDEDGDDEAAIVWARPRS